MTFATERTPVVVDASVLVEALLGDPSAADALARLASETTLLAPPIVWLEVANALHERHRLPAVDVASALGYLEALGLETADRGAAGARRATGLAEQQSLTVYDAAYLWLAIDVDGALATFDRDLDRAAQAEGVPLYLAAA